MFLFQLHPDVLAFLSHRGKVKVEAVFDAIVFVLGVPARLISSGNSLPQRQTMTWPKRLDLSPHFGVV